MDRAAGKRHRRTDGPTLTRRTGNGETSIVTALVPLLRVWRVACCVSTEEEAALCFVPNPALGCFEEETAQYVGDLLSVR